MITVVDYGMGNLGSVVKALEYLGCQVEVSRNSRQIENAQRLVLPGVGAMSYAMEQLVDLDLVAAIKNYLAKDRPFLGICLGMQLMFEYSEEGKTNGLGCFKGRVKRFSDSPRLKIPHMGWNQITDSRLPLIPSGTSYYFVHSYFVVPEDKQIIAAESMHGTKFTAAVACKNILLTQFHPEKSGDAGIRMLGSWLKL